jgi:hypothetical protein
MTDYLYVSGESSRQSMAVPAAQTDLAQVFAWMASEPEDEGLVMTDEILSEPGALEEIMAALAELDRGEGVEGIEAIRALLPKGE